MDDAWPSVAVAVVLDGVFCAFDFHVRDAGLRDGEGGSKVRLDVARACMVSPTSIIRAHIVGASLTPAIQISYQSPLSSSRPSTEESLSRHC